eukprot:scpid35815/ scgid3423/ 
MIMSASRKLRNAIAVPSVPIHGAATNAGASRVSMATGSRATMWMSVPRNHITVAATQCVVIAKGAIPASATETAFLSMKTVQFSLKFVQAAWLASTKVAVTARRTHVSAGKALREQDVKTPAAVPLVLMEVAVWAKTTASADRVGEDDFVQTQSVHKTVTIAESAFVRICVAVANGILVMRVKFECTPEPCKEAATAWLVHLAAESAPALKKPLMTG